ncbi:MAG: SDR family NAD(P)-dependent oxidoreductase [Bacteroidales bacterium]|nr:SDR family NAD(P)-dependent oxidoreductase [Bacteroidales bacterium]
MSKIAIITGADGGMGQEHVRAVSAAGYEVVMACHHPTKGQAICDRLCEETGKPIRMIPLDLSSFASIYQFVSVIRDNYPEIHLLLNNAGTLLHHAEQTADGVEKTVGVNYLGHYLLTRQLLPLLPDGARIVNMVSLTIRYGKIDHDIFTPVDQKHFNRFTCYSDSKLALLYFTLDLADELKDRNILVNCADPGIVSTNIIRQGNPLVDKLCDWFFRPIIYQPHKGASTMIHLALSPEITTSGGCYARKKQVKLKKKMVDNPYRQSLRQKTDALIEQINERM